MQKLKVGIIGCGVIFDLNILGYLNNPDIQVTCLCDKRKKHAEQKIKKFNLNSEIKIYTDYTDMLDSENLDIIEILLPHHLHCETTLCAAQTQLKGISVQKPMATTISECDKMIKACEKNNIKLKIFENFTFYPPIMRAKQLLKEGIIGELNSFHIKTIESPYGGWNVPTYNAPYGNPYTMTPEEEMNMLRDDASAIKAELDSINKRIEELASQSSES